jgi:hypothetical protein
MLTYFTDPTILEKIGRSPLEKLLTDTAPESHPLKNWLPGADARNDEYFAAFAQAIGPKPKRNSGSCERKTGYSR